MESLLLTSGERFNTSEFSRLFSSKLPKALSFSILQNGKISDYSWLGDKITGPALKSRINHKSGNVCNLIQG